MLFRLLTITFFAAMTVFSQTPPIEPGVSQTLAQWRAARYSDVRYKLNLTLEKMSPVLKGTIEIRVKVNDPAASNKDSPPYEGGVDAALGGRGGYLPPIILDWRAIAGHEKDSTVSNVSVNDVLLKGHEGELYVADSKNAPYYILEKEHIILRDKIKPGENVIKLDFTSPILTSGSAITRYVDKEDGSEYLYSLFVPSDASTAFPVFDQPDLKARFSLEVSTPDDWNVVTNTNGNKVEIYDYAGNPNGGPTRSKRVRSFEETKPISTYVFAFAAGPFAEFLSGKEDPISGNASSSKPNRSKAVTNSEDPLVDARQLPSPTPSDTSSQILVDPDGFKDPFQLTAEMIDRLPRDNTPRIYVRKSQADKFKPHAAETFRLTREGIKYLETYFDYKFPFPKYDLVLIPEFPFGGMEHAGATFLKESSVIFPTEPTSGDYISRANLIFHETAHQWFGDTVTMKWFDDLWLKEGFAEFMAYKTLEKVMPEANAWKVFYERNKQAAYLTDSTRGTTPIYQPIANLASAKSAYGNIVYRKAPSFLRQAEFYLGEDKFQTAVRVFLKKHEYANAGWEDLVDEFQAADFSEQRKADFYLKLTIEQKTEYEKFEARRFRNWGSSWVNVRGMPIIRIPSSLLNDRFKPDWGINLFDSKIDGLYPVNFTQKSTLGEDGDWQEDIRVLKVFENGDHDVVKANLGIRRHNTITTKSTTWDAPGIVSLSTDAEESAKLEKRKPLFIFPNYQDYGYGIFLLDDKSRDYVLKNIGLEKDPFLRSMMWGSLWDSVREAELDPKDYVELAIKNLPTEQDETIVASILGRVSTAMSYYLSDTQRTAVAPRLEAVLLDRLQHAPTAGQRITFYRAFVGMAATDKGREVLKQMLSQGSQAGENHPVGETPPPLLRKEGSPEKTQAGSLRSGMALRTKDKFDIVTRLITLGDADAAKLLAGLEKIETGDDAKRYAYAAHAAFGTAENKAKFWNDFINNKDISESWIESAMVPFNSIRHADLTKQYLSRALAELPNLKRTRKIFFVNGWLGAFIGGQRDQAALDAVNKFLADNPTLDNDLRLKILENVDLIERAVKIRAKYGK